MCAEIGDTEGGGGFLQGRTSEAATLGVRRHAVEIREIRNHIAEFGERLQVVDGVPADHGDGRVKEVLKVLLEHVFTGFVNEPDGMRRGIKKEKSD